MFYPLIRRRFSTLSEICHCGGVGRGAAAPWQALGDVGQRLSTVQLRVLASGTFRAPTPFPQDVCQLRQGASATPGDSSLNTQHNIKLLLLLGVN